MLSFAKKMYVEVSDPLKEEDVLRKLDDTGRKQYQLLKEKYLKENVKVSENNNIIEDTKKNLYEEKLKELDIKKIIKKGFNSSSITNSGIGYTRFSIPTYYTADERNEFSDNNKLYSVDDNDNVELCLIRIDDDVAGNNINDYRKALSNGKISENIESIIQNEFRDNTAEVFDYEDVEINNQTWNRFKVLSDKYYYEVVEFLDVNTEQTSDKANDKYVFMILREPITDELEYNEDFSKIIGSIKKIETVKLGKDLEDIKKMGFIDAKEYLENKGFYNFEIYYMKESDGLLGLGAKKNNEIEIITINNNSKLKSDDNVRQDAKIVIEYYNTAKYNEAKEKNEKIDKYLEERKKRNEELEEEQRLQREKKEKENRLNSKQTLSLEEINKVKLVTEYSDETLVEEMDTVKFGKYPQDSRDEEDKQDIEWIVLDRKDGKALLLSKYILDCKKYDDKTNIKQLYEKIEMLEDELGSEHWDKAIEKYKQELQGIADTIYVNDDIGDIINSELEIKFYEEMASYLKNQSDEKLKEYIEKLEELIDIEKTIISEEDNYKITWGECTLRKWLNEDFVNVAFTDSENNQIAESNIKNFDNYKYKTKGGEYTLDKIFCLSIDEVEKYFGDNGDKTNNRIATSGTKYAKMVDNDGYNLYVTDEDGYEGCSPYWLRSPGEEAAKVSIMNVGGAIVNDGISVENEQCGVRPAIWVEY